MRRECVRTDRDVEMSIRQEEEWKKKSGRGERICWYSASSALTHHHSPGKHTVSYTVTKTRCGLVHDRFSNLLGFISIVIFQGFVNVPHSGKNMRQIYAATIHANLTGCRPLFPVSTHSSLFQSLTHTNQSRHEAVCHGCTAEEMLCINLFRQWLTLDEMKWAVCLSLSHPVVLLC